MPDWVHLGNVVRAQIQILPLKTGERPWRTYHPEFIATVDRMTVDADGISAVVETQTMLDVHHRDHPQSRHRPGRELSLGFTSHYALIADRFGPVDMGCGAENLIIETDEVVPLEIGNVGFAIDCPDGTIEFTPARPAQPCAPFTRYLLGTPEASIEEVAADQAMLRDGVRGFLLGTDHLVAPISIGVGDAVYRSAT